MPLRQLLSPHQVETAYERGWNTLKNGALLSVAEQEGFEVLVTTDQNLRYQQNLGDWRVAVVVLSSTSWPRIQKAVTAIRQAIEAALPGSCTEVDIP